MPDSYFGTWLDLSDPQARRDADESALPGRGPRVRECEYCGARFRTFPSTLRAGNGRFCSISCASSCRSNSELWKERYRSVARKRVSEPFEYEDSSVCRVELTRGKTALIDAEDADAVGTRSWNYSSPGGYAGAGGGVILHRFLMQPSASEQVDHISGDRLDNRRCNLRIATHALNQQNLRPHPRSNTGVRGVYRLGSKFGAKVTLGGKAVFRKRFATLAEAEAAVREARAKHHPFSSEAQEADRG